MSKRITLSNVFICIEYSIVFAVFEPRRLIIDSGGLRSERRTKGGVQTRSAQQENDQYQIEIHENHNRRPKAEFAQVPLQFRTNGGTQREYADRFAPTCYIDRWDEIESAV